MGGACASRPSPLNNENNDKRNKDGFFVWKRNGSRNKKNAQNEQTTKLVAAEVHSGNRKDTRNDDDEANPRRRGVQRAAATEDDEKQALLIKTKENFLIETFPASPYNARARYSLSTDKNQNETLVEDIGKKGKKSLVRINGGDDAIKGQQTRDDVLKTVEKPPKVEEEKQSNLENDETSRVDERKIVLPDEKQSKRVEETPSARRIVELESKKKLEETSVEVDKNLHLAEEESASKSDIIVPDIIVKPARGVEGDTKNELEGTVETAGDEGLESISKSDIIVPGITVELTGEANTKNELVGKVESTSKSDLFIPDTTIQPTIKVEAVEKVDENLNNLDESTPKSDIVIADTTVQPTIKVEAVEKLDENLNNVDESASKSDIVVPDTTIQPTIKVEAVEKLDENLNNLDESVSESDIVVPDIIVQPTIKVEVIEKVDENLNNLDESTSKPDIIIPDTTIQPTIKVEAVEKLDENLNNLDESTLKSDIIIPDIIVRSASDSDKLNELDVKLEVEENLNKLEETSSKSDIIIQPANEADEESQNELAGEISLNSDIIIPKSKSEVLEKVETGESLKTSEAVTSTPEIIVQSTTAVEEELNNELIKLIETKESFEKSEEITSKPEIVVQSTAKVKEELIEVVEVEENFKQSTQLQSPTDESNSELENKPAAKPVKKLSDFKLFIFDKYAERLSEHIHGHAMTGIEDIISSDQHLHSIEFDEELVTNKINGAKHDEELNEFARALVESVINKCLQEQNESLKPSVSVVDKIVDIPQIQEDHVDGEEEEKNLKDDPIIGDLKRPDSNKYDRPLSGYAEKLAAFLDDDEDEEDFELTDSEDDEEDDDDDDFHDDDDDDETETESESDEDIELQILEDEIKANHEKIDIPSSGIHHESKQTDSSINVESEKPTDENIDSESLTCSERGDDLSEKGVEPNGVGGTSEEQGVDRKNSDSKINKKAVPVVLRKRQNKVRRTRGERPKSLYEQDVLNSFLNNEHASNAPPASDDEDENVAAAAAEVKPVSERALLMEEKILPLLQRSNSVPTDGSIDDLYAYQTSPRPSLSKPPVIGRAVVIDPGCGVLKAGISGEMRPSCYCPSVIGVPRRFSQDLSKMKKGFYVGDDAWTVAGMLQIEHPIKQEIGNWSDVSNIYEYIFDEALEVHSNEHPVLLTELSLTSAKNRQKITEVMFEKFSVPSFYLANQSCLAMYSKGLTSGLSFSSGFYHTQVTPVYEGHALPHATLQLDIGGDQITDFLGRSIMGTQGVVFKSSSEKLILNSMKQDLCYVAVDPKSEEEKYKNSQDMFRSFALPDGQLIDIGVERYIAPEVMFDPSVIGIRNQPNVVDLIYDSVSRVDVDLKSTMLQNVVMSGGNSKLRGFQERMKAETKRHDNNHGCVEDQVNIDNVDDPLLSTWIGGSVLASIEGFRDQWITLENYAEYGSQVVHTMCF